MIYLLYIILITRIISYDKMLIMYHMSSRETHLSNIHLTTTRISAYYPFAATEMITANTTAIMHLMV